MACLVDTNCLPRWSQPHHPLHAIARSAVSTLRLSGESLFLTSQNLIEFWNVATRPINRNGFGYSVSQADQEVTRLEGFFRMAPDTTEVYEHWRRLVVAVGVSGVQVRDARLVAVMHPHNLAHILTFNTGDFTRYGSITVVHPQDVGTS